MDSDSCSFNPSNLSVHAVNRLLVLQIIVAMALAFPRHEFDEERLFYSSLDSVSSISDRILRKLRGLLMVVSLDSTKLELLEDDNQKFTPNKFKEKVASSSRKKKGKNRNAKKHNYASNNREDGSVPDQTLKVLSLSVSIVIKQFQQIRYNLSTTRIFQDRGSALVRKKNLDNDPPKRTDGILMKVSGPSPLSPAEKGVMLLFDVLHSIYLIYQSPILPKLSYSFKF